MTLAPPERCVDAPVLRPPRRALVLDEDPVVRVAVTNVLAVMGWSVQAVGQEMSSALDAVADRGEPYDLVVLDQALGDGLADDLARLLPVLQPRAHVVMLTDGALQPVPEGVACLLPRGRGLGPLLDHLAVRTG